MAAKPRTLLDELRSRSQVDGDTLDYTVAETLRPFVDCTSNQAIAFAELQKPANEPIIIESIRIARELHSQYASEVTLEQLATEIMMISLSARLTPFLTGRAHIQTNPYNSYSTSSTIANAHRLVSLYAHILPSFPAKRICIKIPSTWEGILACAELESAGVNTLATTLFSPEQAVLAKRAGCAYVAPYVNELGVHFDPLLVDQDKGFALCRDIQHYYLSTGSKTQVLPASLTSIQEVMALAGAQHITVSPPLLAELAATPADSAALPSVFDQAGAENGGTGAEVDWESLEEAAKDEAKWRMAFTRSKKGANERKLVDAINIFADMQDGMEGLVRSYL